MIVSVKHDLEDVSDAMEHLKAQLPRLTREESVDVAARVRAIAKTAEEIDKAIKAVIKTWRKGKEGTVLGEVFKAVLKLIPTTRFNSKALEAAEPKVYAKYLETDDVTRITFEAR